jgi:hypothetical protein
VIESSADSPFHLIRRLGLFHLAFVGDQTLCTGQQDSFDGNGSTLWKAAVSDLITGVQWSGFKQSKQFLS